MNVQAEAVQAAGVDVAKLQHDRRIWTCGNRSPIAGVDVGADHQLRQAALVDVGHRQRLHDPARAKDGDPIGDLEDLIQPVRDVEDAGPAPLHLTHHREQALDLVVWKDRGGFIEHEHAAAAVPAPERSCDRDDRPLDGVASASGRWMSSSTSKRSRIR